MKEISNIDSIPVHEQIILKMGVALFENQTDSVIELGERLVEMGSDNISSGGLWIWQYDNNKVYYSPKFCDALQYEYGAFGEGFEGFEKSKPEELAYGIDLITKLIESKSEDKFVNNIVFYKKDGTPVNVICSGTVFYKNSEPLYILGTHAIKDNGCKPV